MAEADATELQNLKTRVKYQEQELEESEDEDEYDSDETEPILKYDRIKNDMKTILTNDAASTMAVHSKFLALGTHFGFVYIMDLAGNNIKNKELPAHQVTVNQISIDENGDYVASCSDDGKVVINGLYNIENDQEKQFDRPIKAVAIDPLFYKHGSGKNYVIGHDKLILSEKGFLGRFKTTSLNDAEGIVRSIKWSSTFIAWVTDAGVKIYDMSTKQKITHISRDFDKSLRAELYRCNLCWKNDRTLLIGWANTVKVCSIKDRHQSEDSRLPSRYVQIDAMFTTDFFISGIAPVNNNILLLAYNEKDIISKDGRQYSPRPNLIVVEPGMNDYKELSNDALSIKGFPNYRCSDYHLEVIPEDSLYYIVSPKEVIVAKNRDLDDHIAWLLEHEHFQEAMDEASRKGKQLHRHTLQAIGKQYLDHLQENGQFEEAAKLCVKVLDRNKNLWEDQVTKFQQLGHLKVLSPYIPQKNPQLAPAIYELVLHEFLHNDPEKFCSLIKEWPPELYNTQTIINIVMERLSHHPESRILLQSLGELYSNVQQFDKALTIYLKLKHPDVFTLINKYDLFDAIAQKIVLLMNFETKMAVQMLIDNKDRIPVENVVRQLEKEPKFLHSYLDELFRRDSEASQSYHYLQVKLYAEFDPPKLLSFLRSSNSYPLEKAFEECKQRQLTPEMVFLLARMGNHKKALSIINEDIGDVDMAIEFCKEHNDQELWDDLIEFSINKPTFVKGLLNNIGTHVDPIILVRKIREGMQIPGLRDSLVKILQDYNLQMSLRTGCQKILISDCFGLLDKQIKIQRKGIPVSSSHICQVCHTNIIVSDLRTASNVVVFFCRHAFHEDCLPVHSTDSCTICSTQKKGPGRTYSMIK